MPLFEYECSKCRNQFEELVSSSKSDEVVACPACGSERTSRLISAFAVSGGERRNGISASGSSCATRGSSGSRGFS